MVRIFAAVLLKRAEAATKRNSVFADELQAGWARNELLRDVSAAVGELWLAARQHCSLGPAIIWCSVGEYVSSDCIAGFVSLLPHWQ